MPLVKNGQIQHFLEILDKYDRYFYDRDTDSLKSLYAKDGEIRFYDNHRGCDSNNLKEHLYKVNEFFKNGKIVDLIREDIKVFEAGDSACVTLLQRYSTEPTPGVRTTIYLEKGNDSWFIRHIHHSYDPNES